MEAKQIVAAIKAGKFTPSEMEDFVYAMEHAYQDFFPSVNMFISNPMEFVADDMVKARECAERIEA